MPGRRIVVRKDDVLIFKGFEIDVEVLKAMLESDARASSLARMTKTR